MEEKIDKNSVEYYLINKLRQLITKSDNKQLKQQFSDKRLIYLDDNREVRETFFDMIDNLTEETYKDAPNHIKGKLKEMTSKDVKQVMKDKNIFIYGRSGLKLNSKELERFD